VRRPQTSRFVERFHRTVLDEFFRTSLRDAVLDRLDDLQARLDAWLVHYNRERPHRGYRNMGKRPVEAFNQASATVGHDG
jgi:transposase InsO family protein